MTRGIFPKDFLIFFVLIWSKLTLSPSTKKFIIVGVGVNVHRSPVIDDYPTTYINFFTKKKLTSFKIYNEIKSINILNLNRLDIYLKNNTNIKLGDYDTNLQMITITNVMKKFKNLSSIDLRNKGRVIIK